MRREASFIDRIAQVGEPDEAIKAFDKSLMEIGAEYHAIPLLPRQGERIEEVCLAWKAPPEWRAFYSCKNLLQRDPAVRQCRRSVMPFDWTSSPYNPETEFRWGEVLARGRDFNIHKGIVVPIPSPTEMIGLVWGAGPHFDERNTYMSLVQVLGLHVFYRLQHLGAAVRRTIRLTERERDVMAWISEGKTAWAIGHKLRVSQRVVEWHIDQACKKLGASDRLQAVAMLGTSRNFEQQASKEARS